MGENSTMEEEDLFLLSTEPEEQQQDNEMANPDLDTPQEVLEVPKYDTMFTGFLTTPEFSMDTGKLIPNDVKPKRNCFNCKGDHNLQECPEARDHIAIAKNRRAHMANRPASTVRYHEIFSNKYCNFSPGVMSLNLRHALGCASNQMPEMVYRMRVLGYPPGWLLEAREKTGEVALYGGDGRAVCQPEGEEGEVGGGATYRSEKLIEYPGFNSPLSIGFKEEGRQYNLPCIQPEHSLRNWRDIMNSRVATPYRKRKMKPSNTGDIDCSVSQLSTSKDSERSAASPELRLRGDAAGQELLEDGEISSGSESVQSLHEEVKSKKRKSDPSQDSDKNASTPTTQHVRKRSKRLDNSTIDLTEEASQEIVTLDSTAENDFSELLDTNPSPLPDDTPSDSNAEADATNGDLLASASETKSKASSGCTTPLDVESNPGTPTTTSTPAVRKRHRRARSKGFVLGAVIPESITPFKALPDADKWTVDVTDHILFENLPDALGTWDNMRGIMKTVRSKMSTLHAED